MTLLTTGKVTQSIGLKSISYRQYLATSPDGAHTERVDGEIVPMPPISDEHQNVGGF